MLPLFSLAAAEPHGSGHYHHEPASGSGHHYETHHYEGSGSGYNYEEADQLEEEMETGDDVPICLETCPCYPDFDQCHFDPYSGEEVCQFIDEAKATGCHNSCDDEVKGMIDYMEDAACTGEWPMPHMDEPHHSEEYYEASGSGDYHYEASGSGDYHYEPADTYHYEASGSGDYHYEPHYEESGSGHHYEASGSGYHYEPADTYHYEASGSGDYHYEEPTYHESGSGDYAYYQSGSGDAYASGADQLEEEMETGEDTPICLETCPCYPDFDQCHFNPYSGEEVCEFIGEAKSTGCHTSCDDMILGFIDYMEAESCSGNWPMPGMEEPEHDSGYYEEQYESHHDSAMHHDSGDYHHEPAHHDSGDYHHEPAHHDSGMYHHDSGMYPAHHKRRHRHRKHHN